MAVYRTANDGHQSEAGSKTPYRLHLSNAGRWLERLVDVGPSLVGEYAQLAAGNMSPARAGRISQGYGRRHRTSIRRRRSPAAIRRRQSAKPSSCQPGARVHAGPRVFGQRSRPMSREGIGHHRPAHAGACRRRPQRTRRLNERGLCLLMAISPIVVGFCRSCSTRLIDCSAAAAG